MEITSADYESLYINWTLAVISFTVLIYEYLLTFIHEVERFWPVWLKNLFIFKSQQFVEDLSYGLNGDLDGEGECFPWASHVLFFVNRTGIGVWAVMASETAVKSPVVYIPYGCGGTLTQTRAHYLGLAWLGELGFDVLIFVMTLWKTLSLRRRGNGIGLLSMLIRDGAVYFGAMVVFNIGNIVTFFAGGPLSRGSLTMLTNIGSSILVSRLMLNLRGPKLSRVQAKSVSSWSDEPTDDLQGVMMTTTIGTDNL